MRNRDNHRSHRFGLLGLRLRARDNRVIAVAGAACFAPGYSCNPLDLVVLFIPRRRCEQARGVKYSCRAMNKVNVSRTAGANNVSAAATFGTIARLRNAVQSVLEAAERHNFGGSRCSKRAHRSGTPASGRAVGQAAARTASPNCQSRCADTLHLLGMVALQQGQACRRGPYP
jgi:hypothetical protein